MFHKLIGHENNRADFLLDENYRNLISDNVHEAIVVIQDGKLVFCSAKAYALTGFSETDSKTIPFTDFFPPEDRAQIMDHYQKRLKGEEAENQYETRLIRKDGQTIWVEINSVNMEWENKAAILSFITDITQWKESAESQRKSEALYQSILNASPDDITITDLNGSIRVVSPAAYRLFGFQQGSGLLSKNILEFLVPEDAQRARDDIVLMRDSNFKGPVEYRAIHADGSLFDIETNAEVIRDAEGQPTGMVFIVRDISQRKQAGEELQKWANIFLNAEWGVTAESAEGYSFELMNPAFARMHGYTVEELSKLSVLDVITPESREELPEIVKIIHETGHHNFESVHVRKDGSRFPVLIDATAIKDKSGKVLFRAVNVQDITERKQSEDVLNVEQILMSNLMNNLPIQIYFKDLKSRFIRINNTQAFRLGVTDPAETIGKTDFDFFTEEHASQAFEDEQTIIRTGEPIRKEEKETYEDQPDSWVLTTKMPLRDKNGKIIGTFGTSMDITERKRASVELH